MNARDLPTEDLSTITGKDHRADEIEVEYHPVPKSARADKTSPQTLWRVRFDLTSNKKISFGLEIYGDVNLGRGKDPNIFDLSMYDAESLGVSRQHAQLRPTDNKLFVLDLGSTNGTQVNGRLISNNTPYSLSNGDMLTLGRLEFSVTIVKRPTGYTSRLRDKADLGEALAKLASAITSQLALEDVLSQALDMAMGLTAAGETTIWLVDEKTGELFLEAERGIDDQEVKHKRLPVTDSLAGQVIATGEPVRATAQADAEDVKIATDYLVKAVIYVPLSGGGVTFGVLSAAHREPGHEFSLRDERLLAAIGNFAAIAIQNAREHEATDRALARRMAELAEINSAMAHDLRKPLASIKGFAQMLARAQPLDDQGTAFVERIIDASGRMMNLVDELLDVALVNRGSQTKHEPCDLVDAVASAVGDLEGAALANSVELDLILVGTPYHIAGDYSSLYRSTLNLLDNAIRYSDQKTQVLVTLTFGDEAISIQVRDSGPGIDEADLPHIFDPYYRGSRSGREKGSLGLGLAVVRSTAKAHDGEVTARNVESGGAEITITLPASLRVE